MEKYLQEIQDHADKLIDENPHEADRGHTPGTIYNLQSLVTNSGDNAGKIVESFNVRANAIIERAQQLGSIIT